MEHPKATSNMDEVDSKLPRLNWIVGINEYRDTSSYIKKREQTRMSWGFQASMRTSSSRELEKFVIAQETFSQRHDYESNNKSLNQHPMEYSYIAKYHFTP